MPFGIAQVGKAFRNEISPRDFIMRVHAHNDFQIHEAPVGRHWAF